MNKVGLWSLAGGLLVAAGNTVAAQPDSSGEGGERQLETVEITATRLGLEASADNGALGARSLLDTPFSVSVVAQEEFARRQATTLGQIFINDSSVFAAEPPASTNWWGTQIRGIGVYNHFVDGVPLLMQWGGEFPLEAVETVTALKGLGGFMYGFGSPGGIFSYTTKRPTDRPLLETSVSYRDSSVFSAHVDAGGRIDGADSLGYRVNLAGEQGDAYSGAGIDRSVASLALELPLGDALIWRAQGLHERSKLKHEPLYFYWDLYEDEALPAPTQDYENVSVRNSYYNSETLHTTTGLDWRINEVWRAALTLGLSRREHNSNKMFAYLQNEGGDYAGNVYNFAGVLRNRVAQAIAQGHWRTGAVRHELVVGASFQKSTDQWGNDWYWSNDFNGNLYQEQDYLAPRVPDFSLAPVSFDEREKALFASDTLHFGAQWQAILGARFTDYTQRDVDGDPGVDSGYSTEEVTPTLALIYKPVQALSLYASYVESLEAGSQVGAPYANAGDVLPATVSRQYEAGAKYAGSSLEFTTAVFRVERASQIDQLRDGLRYLTQDGLARYRGIEANGGFRLNERLRLGLGATLLDASIEQVSPENAELEGNRPAGSSRLQVVANLEYRPAVLAGFSVQGNVRYFGNAYYEDANRIRIPGRTLVNVGAQYETHLWGQQFTLTGNVNNLLDKKYWNLNTLGEARNVTLAARIAW